MDFALLALAVAAGAFILTVVVPIATFLRVRKAADDIRRINGRLNGLEAELTRLHVAARNAAVAEGAGPAVVASGAALAAPAPPARPTVSQAATRLHRHASRRPCAPTWLRRRQPHQPRLHPGRSGTRHRRRGRASPRGFPRKPHRRPGDALHRHRRARSRHRVLREVRLRQQLDRPRPAVSSSAPRPASRWSPAAISSLAGATRSTGRSWPGADSPPSTSRCSRRSASTP